MSRSRCFTPEKIWEESDPSGCMRTDECQHLQAAEALGDVRDRQRLPVAFVSQKQTEDLQPIAHSGSVGANGALRPMALRKQKLHHLHIAAFDGVEIELALHRAASPAGPLHHLQVAT